MLNKYKKGSIEYRQKMSEIMTRPAEPRFWQNVTISDSACCWEWKGALRNGYGVFSVNGKITYAHRYSYKLVYNQIKEGLCVLHKCNNRLCVNPSHLYIGTKQDNANDKVNSNRQIKGGQSKLSKLTEQQVREIKEYKGKLSLRKIANLYKVHHWTIGRILNNINWKHLENSNESFELE